MHRVFISGLVLIAIAAYGQEADERIVVTGEFRDSALDDLPASITVLDEEALEARSARHLEEALILAPNVNVAGGSSRSRFFQIRGIGERGQFVEPLNPSVGLIVDGVDLSNAASGATLFDVEQIEVFRGPQGTRYGANALAGLVNVKTRGPTDEPEARIGLDVANHDASTINGMVSGPLGERVSGRFAVQQHDSDGFVRNTYLGRDDTNRRDELSVRGKLRWDAGDSVSVDGLIGLVDIDNGYDAFSLDNDRLVRSDEPGRDAQETVFGGVDIAWDAATAFVLEASVTAALSDSLYGYDEDWTYVGFHPAGYSSTDYYSRDRETRTAEVRLLSTDSSRVPGGSTDWVLGVYVLDASEDLRRDYTFNTGPFTSGFGVERLALFGQIGHGLGDRMQLTAGLRLERHRSDYLDSAGVAFTPEDDLTGWRLSLDRTLSDALMGYVTLARGYKAGGFNTDGTLPPELRQFEPETLISLELGVKGELLDGRLQTRIAVFNMARDDVQIASSRRIERPGGSTDFVPFTGNAAEGVNRGVEAEFVFSISEVFDLSAAFGLLETEYEDFINAAGMDLDGRAQAHAPDYQYAISGRRNFAGGWYAELGLEGRDAFYFSDGHDARSKSYNLVNAAIAYEHGNWDLRLWSRNLTDEDVLVRGYFFGNDPRIGYEDRAYTQLGEPRRVGFSASYAF